MGEQAKEAGVDLIRWTFTVEPSRKAAVEAYLADLGLEVLSRADGQTVVLWEEPDAEPGEVVAELWERAGGEFEITHEEFRRLDLAIFEPEAGSDDASATAA